MSILRTYRVWSFIRVLSVAFLAIGLLAASDSLVAADSDAFEVVAPDAKVYGQTLDYSEWSAEWWKWAQGLPVDVIGDPTGEHCAEGQSGDVWFLAGTTPGGDPITRECTVPADKALFFPVQNILWIQDDTSDPPFGDGSHALGVLNFLIDEYGGGISVTVDRKKVKQLDEYRIDSVPFLITFPDGNVSAPAIDAGHYLMLEPLEEGEHTIRITGWKWWAGGLDVTYDLTVQ